MKTLRRVMLLLGGLAASLSLVATAQAATPRTQYKVTRIDSPDPQLNGRWGERVAVAGDETGDKIPDFFVVGLHYSPSPDVPFAGRVYLLNGKTGAVVYRIDSPEPQAQAQFGFYIATLGDVDRDGKDDIAIGTDAQDIGPNIDQGKAWVFSGANGKLLYALDNPAPQGTAANRARFGSRIGRAGDVTGDKVSDIIVGASANDSTAGCADATPITAGCRKDQGQAFIFNGANGSLVRTLDLPAEDQAAGASCATNCGTFGVSVQGPGDVDGDGVPDQLIDAGNYSFYTGSGAPCGTPEPNGCNEGQGRMYLFSGKTGALIRRIDDPDPQAGASFGFQDAKPLTPGDVNGDGVNDIYGNGFLANGPAGDGDGRAWVFSGKTGVLLHELKDPTPEPGGQFGFSESSADYNKDGVPDTYVGQSPHHVEGADENGGTYIYDGKTGSLLKALTLPASDTQAATPDNGGPRLGWTNASLGDVNGDAQPDYAAGTPFADATFKDQGVFYAFLSTDTTRPRLPGVRGPRVTHGDRSPSYAVTTRDSDNTAEELTLLCRFDDLKAARCGKEFSKRLTRGRHVLNVQASDPAGNRSRMRRIHVVIGRG